jgi:desulfoferrodoxin-like iron-binding protein
MGKVYYCSICGLVVRVIKDGRGTLVCCGKEMEVVDIKVEESESKELYACRVCGKEIEVISIPTRVSVTTCCNKDIRLKEVE